MPPKMRQAVNPAIYFDPPLWVSRRIAKDPALLILPENSIRRKPFCGTDGALPEIPRAAFGRTLIPNGEAMIADQFHPQACSVLPNSRAFGDSTDRKYVNRSTITQVGGCRRAASLFNFSARFQNGAGGKADGLRWRPCSAAPRPRSVVEIAAGIQADVQRGRLTGNWPGQPAR